MERKLALDVIDVDTFVGCSAELSNVSVGDWLYKPLVFFVGILSLRILYI